MLAPLCRTPVQQEETPQPPPLKPPDGAAKPPSELEQQKEDMSFFTFFDEHLGQQASFSDADIFCNRENFSLQETHMYS